MENNMINGIIRTGAKATGVVLICNVLANADIIKDAVDSIASIFDREGITYTIDDTTDEQDANDFKIETRENAYKEIRGTEVNAAAAITANKPLIGKQGDTSYVKIMFLDSNYSAVTDSAIQELNTNPKRLYVYFPDVKLAQIDSVLNKYLKTEKEEIIVGVKKDPFKGFKNPEPRKDAYLRNVLGKRVNSNYRGVQIQNKRMQVNYR